MTVYTSCATRKLSIAHIRRFKDDLRKHFDITDLGELHYILGIQVVRDRPTHAIYLNQTAYIRSMLEKFSMASCAPTTTLLTVKECLTTAQSLSTPEECNDYDAYTKGLKYLKIVSAILYTTQTCPDIQHAISVLAQFGANPGKPHLEALKRVLRYLKGTAHFSLRLSGENSDTNLVGWTDSDWAQAIDSCCSIGGFVFEVAGGVVSWSSKKQPTVALSTVEAKYMAASNAMKEAI
ncbi:hypothetical protein BN946_scf184962.g43 [Trametes cinnabarina]|uniref:Reverse transcriptase Ty1/copia-type domain-containing protein n=1 Tax=Pycnoporus cinnabarinus TaxID=5643 RepID=A0A060SCL2_PYCCI|nr:hypothetical protein BN946_scf184962.g43 [Trametes cinnabarina]